MNEQQRLAFLRLLIGGSMNDIRSQLEALAELGALPRDTDFDAVINDLGLDRPPVDPTTLSADEMVHELQNVIAIRCYVRAPSFDYVLLSVTGGNVLGVILSTGNTIRLSTASVEGLTLKSWQGLCEWMPIRNRCSKLIHEPGHPQVPVYS